MIALLIAPIYFGLLVLLLVKSIKYFKHRKRVYFTFFTCLSILTLVVAPLTIVLGFLLPTGNLKRIFTIIGNYWLGISLYLLIGVGVTELLRLVSRLLLPKIYNDRIAKLISNAIIVVFTVSMSIYGIANAHDLKITKYDVGTIKQASNMDLNVVLISDLHLGYNVGCNEMKTMVKKVNQLNPDVVLLAGDIFDNDWDALDNPKELTTILKGINSKYGNYAVYGNHDIQEKILCGFTFSWGKNKGTVKANDEMNNFINDAGFTLLYDEYITINDEKGKTIAYVYGRPDYEKPNCDNSSRKSPSEIVEGMDKEKYIICLDHEPRELNELSNVGVDLDLNGHTHNGQVWPGTYTINLFWDNAYGLKYFGNMANIVTSGVGLFGPNIRTGCNAEIVEVFVHFKK